MIDHQDQELEPAELYLPWSQFNGAGVTPAVNEGGTGTYAAGALFPFAETGTVLLKQVSTFGFVAPLMVTAADEIGGFVKIPYGLFNWNYPLYFKVHWTSGSSTTADTIDFKVFADFKGEGVALAAATTALDTVIAQDTVTGAYHSQFTAAGVKNAAWATKAQLKAGLTLCFLVEMDAFAAGLTEDKHVLGLQILGTPHRYPNGRKPSRNAITALGLA